MRLCGKIGIIERVGEVEAGGDDGVVVDAGMDTWEADAAERRVEESSVAVAKKVL